MITFVSDTELREKCSCFKIYIESEGDNQDENPIQKTKITQLKTSRGIERKMALEKGDIWVRPTTYMSLKNVYNRNHKKKETRQMILEYRGLSMINATALRPVSAENMNVVSNVSNVLTKAVRTSKSSIPNRLVLFRLR